MRRRLRHFFGIVAPILIGGLLAFVLLCIINQWDRFAVITLFPIWGWAIFGCFSSLLFALLLKSKSCIALFFLWLFTAIIVADESRNLGREFWVAVSGSEITAEPDERVLRVVTINCSEGKLGAAGEIKTLQPDIVFLQEAPRKILLDPLILDVFEGQGSYISHHENVILARGNFSGKKVPSDSNSTFWVRLTMLDGQVFDLANVHLSRAIPRLDVWKRGSRADFTKNRIKNRTLLRHLMRFREGPESPVIVGGDFSTPPGDDIFRMLKKAGMEDASLKAPAGSGNTFPDDFSILRIDQIWVSKNVIPLSIDAVQSEFTDHKMVVCDFVYRPSKKN